MSNEKSAPATSSAPLGREVRPGDRITRPWQPKTFLVREVTPTRYCFDDGSTYAGIDAAIEQGWTHADGTPIDPPRKAAPTAGELIDRKYNTPDIKPDDDWKAVSEQWRQRFNAADRRAEDALRQLQMLEADAKTVNTDFDRALCEHKEEISFLRRELKRLDPRLWKARYGRG